jgi:D-tyrosyl-tRNA(Tyr) deacylase
MNKEILAKYYDTTAEYIEKVAKTFPTVYEAMLNEYNLRKEIEKNINKIKKD